MKDPTTRFSDRVNDYIKFRPHYPKEIIKLFESSIHFDKEFIVADIGAGTGISSELFLENGNIVYAVEPNFDMRKASQDLLESEFNNFKSINGTAEKTGIPDKTIDLIVVCQAFHWFNLNEAKIEFKRIIKSNGYLSLIWNERNINSNPFMQAYENLLKKYVENYNYIENKNLNDQSFVEFFGTPDFNLEILKNYQIFDFEGLKGRLLSASYVPKEGKIFENIIYELKNIFERYQHSDQIIFEYNTKVYYSKLI